MMPQIKVKYDKRCNLLLRISASDSFQLWSPALDTCKPIFPFFSEVVSFVINGACANSTAGAFIRNLVALENEIVCPTSNSDTDSNPLSV